MKILALLLPIFLVLLTGCDPKIAEIGRKKLDLSNYFTLMVDGITVAYQKLGKGEPLVLIHGFMGNSTNFQPILSELSKDFTVIAVDLPGFGLSEKNITKPLSRRYLAKVVSSLVAQLGFSRYSVLGHSMGGEVAMWLALDNPNAVEKLILSNSAGWITDSNRSMPLLDLPFSQVFVRTVFFNYEFLKNAWIEMLVDKEKFDEEYFLGNYSLMYGTPYKVIQNLVKNLDTNVLMQNIDQITTPTLLIWGDLDSVIPVDHAWWFHEKIKDSKVFVIEKAGHLPFIDKPEIFTDLVRAFLENIKE